MIFLYFVTLLSATCAITDNLYKHKYIDRDESEPYVKAHNDCWRRRNHDHLQQDFTCYKTDTKEKGGDFQHTSYTFYTPCEMDYKKKYFIGSIKHMTYTFEKEDNKMLCHCDKDGDFLKQDYKGYCVQPGHYLGDAGYLPIQREVCSGSGKLKYYGMMCDGNKLHKHMVQSGKLKEEK